MAYYAPSKFSSLLFSPGTLSGHVDSVWSNFFCKLSFGTSTSFDRFTNNKNSVNIYIFK